MIRTSKFQMTYICKANKYLPTKETNAVYTTEYSTTFHTWIYPSRDTSSNISYKTIVYVHTHKNNVIKKQQTRQNL